MIQIYKDGRDYTVCCTPNHDDSDFAERVFYSTAGSLNPDTVCCRVATALTAAKDDREIRCDCDDTARNAAKEYARRSAKLLGTGFETNY